MLFNFKFASDTAEPKITVLSHGDQHSMLKTVTNHLQCAIKLNLYARSVPMIIKTSNNIFFINKMLNI